jgi:DNA-binding MarR family transcriptional regulator
MSLPLSTLLSQALVAFTIEFDNEFEHQMPHRTTNHGSTTGSHDGPWLVSLVMWSNCMQFIGEDGVRVGELEDLARTPTNLNGMERWGYVTVQPDPADTRPKPPRSAWVIRATPKGKKAQEVWRPLFGVIEKRWEERFGKDRIDQLRESLKALVSAMDVVIDVDLPDCLPILGYGLFSKVSDRKMARERTPIGRDLPSMTLVTLLSRVLLAFAIEFERESNLSLAISANVLRVLSESGVRIRDLPLLTGVSKQAISMATGILQKRGVAVVEQNPSASRTKVAHLTPKGRKAQEGYQRLLGVIEERWQGRFGKENIRTLRERLKHLVCGPRPEPYPKGWRASVPKPRTLPHYPMVLHRGGFPDGS